MGGSGIDTHTYTQTVLVLLWKFLIYLQGKTDGDITVITRTILRTVIQSVIGMDRSSTLVVSPLQI